MRNETIDLLRVEGLTKHFGGLKELQDIHFNVKPGEIVGVIGPNGAGKTTLFNAITGYFKLTSGNVVFREQNITGIKPNRVSKLGLVRTFQLVNLIDSLSVYENLRLGHFLHRRVSVLSAVLNTMSARREEDTISESIELLLNQMDLMNEKDELAGSLSHGQKRVLGMGIAMAVKPKLLLLDEPAAGLNRTETATMTQHVQRVRSEGVSIMIVEHDMKVIMDICDRIIVLNFGKKITEGSPQEVSTNEEVISAYLGYKKENKVK